MVRTGVLGIYYWIEVRMESEEEHTGRQMETTTTMTTTIAKQPKITNLCSHHVYSRDGGCISTCANIKRISSVVEQCCVGTRRTVACYLDPIVSADGFVAVQVCVEARLLA